MGCQLNNVTLGPDFMVSGSANAQLSPAAAALGTNFLVVWADTRAHQTSSMDIYGVRLDQNGAALDTAAIPICTATNDQLAPAVAANGTNYLAVWSDRRNTPSNALHGDIYGALISGFGTVLQSNGFAICTATNDQTTRPWHRWELISLSSGKMRVPICPRRSAGTFTGLV